MLLAGSSLAWTTSALFGLPLGSLPWSAVGRHPSGRAGTLAAWATGGSLLGAWCLEVVYDIVSDILCDIGYKIGYEVCIDIVLYIVQDAARIYFTSGIGGQTDVNLGKPV